MNMDYKERQQKRDTEATRRRSMLQDIAPQIAAALGPDFKVRHAYNPAASDYPDAPGDHLWISDGEIDLGCSVVTYGADAKVTIDMVCPRDEVSGRYSWRDFNRDYANADFEISQDWTRPVAKLVADLRRRLLDPGLPILREVIAACGENQGHAERQRERFKALLAAFDRDDDDSLYQRHNRGGEQEPKVVRIDSESIASLGWDGKVTFQLRLPAADSAKVAAMVAGLAGREQTVIMTFNVKDSPAVDTLADAVRRMIPRPKGRGAWGIYRIEKRSDGVICSDWVSTQWQGVHRYDDEGQAIAAKGEFERTSPKAVHVVSMFADGLPDRGSMAVMFPSLSKRG